LENGVTDVRGELYSYEPCTVEQTGDWSAGQCTSLSYPTTLGGVKVEHRPQDLTAGTAYRFRIRTYFPSLGLAGPTSAYAVADAQPRVLFSRRSAALLEGNAATGDPVWTVALSRRPSGNVQVVPGAPGDTRLSFVTGVLTFTPSNWFTPQALNVRSVSDSDRDDNIEQISLNSPGYAPTEVLEITSIDGDKNLVPSVASDKSVTASEDGTLGEFTVRVSNAPDFPVTVAVSLADAGITTVMLGSERPSQV